jgi:acyl-CoA hydrolase
MARRLFVSTHIEGGHGGPDTFAGSRPHFLAVDEVTFSLPVDVGTLLAYEAMVVYTEPALPSPRVHVRVLASIVQPEAR